MGDWKALLSHLGSTGPDTRSDVLLEDDGTAAETAIVGPGATVKCSIMTRTFLVGLFYLLNNEVSQKKEANY